MKTQADVAARQKQGFAAVANARSRVLILGSMPGEMSLQQQQYYAHPRNAFWPLMARLFDFDAHSDYAKRVQVLLQHRVALWDVLHACKRAGSLDANIESGSIVVNDLAGFFAQHQSIRQVFFNGKKAEAEFQRRVMPSLSPQTVLSCKVLPSTSPAMASLDFEQKWQAWRVVRQAVSECTGLSVAG